MSQIRPFQWRVKNVNPCRVLLGLVLVAVSLDARADLSWYEVDVSDAHILSNLSRSNTTQIVQSLQDYRAALERVFPLLDKHLHTPVQIALLGPSLNWGLPCSNCGGVTYAQEGATYIFVGAPNPLFASRALLHEFTHKLLYETYHGVLPVWYEEGLAEFFDTARREHGQLAIGMAPADRWLDFKAARWMPLREVFEVGRDSPEYRGHGEHGREAEQFYAESWLLVHYTQLGKPEYAKPIARYLTGIDHGLAPSDALASAFPEGIEPLETELQAYARQSRFRAALIDIPSDPRVSDEALRPVPSLEGDKRVITMLLEPVRHPSPSFLHGVVDLSKRNRDDPTVSILLAIVYQYDHQFNLADPLLQRTCVLPFSRALNAYLCANAYKNRTQEFKPKTSEHTAALAQARLCYEDALRIQPLYLQALAGLADTYIDETGDSSEVRTSLESALQTDPQNTRIALQLAQLYTPVDLKVAKRYGERALLGAQSFEDRSEILRALQDIDNKGAEPRPAVTQ